MASRLMPVEVGALWCPGRNSRRGVVPREVPLQTVRLERKGTVHCRKRRLQGRDGRWQEPDQDKNSGSEGGKHTRETRRARQTQQCTHSHRAVSGTGNSAAKEKEGSHRNCNAHRKMQLISALRGRSDSLFKL